MGEEIPVITTVVGYCRPIVDRTFILNADQTAHVLREHEIDLGVSFHDDSVLIEVERSLVHRNGVSATSSPGGPVSNALYSLANALNTYPRSVELVWTGPYPRAGANDVDDPLPSLRANGVRTVLQPATSLLLPRSLCLVGREHGDTQAILVGEREPLNFNRPLPSGHIAMSMLSDFPDVAAAGNAAAYALMTADLPAITPQIDASIASAAREQRIRFVFGTLAEFQRLELIDADWNVDSRFYGAEVVATDGPRPVSIWRPGEKERVELEIPELLDSEGTFLGAGDAYAGAYLAARLGGTDPADAHTAAAAAARRASYHHRARAVNTPNLTELFGAYIERASGEPDYHLFDTVRHTAGTTVISCGNTGVDEVGGRCAARLGLSFFAVMPMGRRRDDDSEAPRNWDVLELGTPSYRFCTWTNVYLADGTVLIDLAGTEGSAETRRAAQVLQRPILEVDPREDLAVTYQRAIEWSARHGIRVVNIAGNRARSLGVEMQTGVEHHTDALLRAIASQYQVGITPIDNIDDIDAHEQAVAIGIPRLSEVSDAVREVLEAAPFDSNVDADMLTWHVGPSTIIRAKSRDLVAAVGRGDLAAAFVGLDMVLDSPDVDVDVVARTGLFNSIVALIRPGVPRPETGRVGSQYPSLGLRVLPASGELIKLAGAGEGWVASGLLDGVVDTWRTGKTARQHGLELDREIARCPLVLITAPGAQVPALARFLLAKLVRK